MSWSHSGFLGKFGPFLEEVSLHVISYSIKSIKIVISIAAKLNKGLIVPSEEILALSSLINKYLSKSSGMNLNIQHILKRIDCLIDVDIVIEHVVISLKIDFLSEGVGGVENVRLEVLHVVKHTLSIHLIIKAEEVLYDLEVVDILEHLVHCRVVC